MPASLHWSISMTSENGMGRYVSTGDPVAILFEDAGFRIFSKPPNLHLLSTVGLLRGLERVGVIASADPIIYEMTHPSKPGRRPADARVLKDMPDGVDDPAAVGSTWLP
jgi:transketolase C-terminal domain/subunit